MAKIKDAKPKNSSGGYERVFDDKNIGDILKKVQSTVISNGNELEKIVIDSTKAKIQDLDLFIETLKDGKTDAGVYLCEKKIIKKSSYKLDKNEPDILIFLVFEKETICYVVELKDGDDFDTKKADGERQHLLAFKKHLEGKLSFNIHIYICSFNNLNKESIKKGFKDRFELDEILTGKELCDLLKIDYNSIISKRKEDAPENYDYFMNELMKIETVRKKVNDFYRHYIIEEDFYKEDETN